MIHRSPIAIALAAALTSTFVASPALSVSREEVMIRARAFASHPWHCAQSNLTASCSSSYKSVYAPGDYVGLPYDWGGYMSLFSFDQQMTAGAGAGSYPNDGILDCTAGLDCSGYVSQCWGTGHLTTSSLHEMSTPIQMAELLPADAFNQAGYHVMLFSHKQGNGVPVFYEAIGYNVHVNRYGGWSYVNNYKPMRLNNITGTSAGAPQGTPDNPIVIGSFPYSASGDTSKSSSSALDGCGTASSKPEQGPEVVYEVHVTKPGTVTAAVSDDVGVDVDIHLYTSMNTNDCVARHDQVITQAVDCGTYYLVVDTFGTDDSNAGPYSLTVDFSPSGQSCGSGPPSYHPKGALGDSCGYPGHEDLPFCNPNLGGEVCVYTTTTSFCSRPCAGQADCAAFQGGCCKDIGQGEHYCVISSLCQGAGGQDGGTTPTDGGDTDGGTQGQDASTTDGGGAGGGTGGTGLGGAAGSAGGGAAPNHDAGAGGAGATAGSAGEQGTGSPHDASANGDSDAGTCSCRQVGSAAGSPPPWAWLASLGMLGAWLERKRHRAAQR